MKPLIAALAALSTFALAADLKVGDRTYIGYEITKVEPDGITISHSEGIAKIPFSDLPEAIQKQHGYDPAKAARYAAQSAKLVANRERNIAAEAAKKKALEAMEKRAVKAEFKILQVFENGILADAELDFGIGPLTRERTTFIYGRLKAVDGESYSATLYPAGRFSYATVLGAKKTVTAWALDAESALANFKE